MRPDYGTNSCSLSSNFYEKNLTNNSVSSTMTLSKGSSDLLLQNEKSVLNPRKHSGGGSISSYPVKLYRRRYLMLFLFILCSMMNGIPQFQYTVVADIVACYYSVSLNKVNWTSIVYMVAFLPLVFPVMYLMDTKGLKITIVIGGLLNVLGSIVQCCSFAPDRFLFVFICQTIYAVGQVFVLSIPPFLAGKWFGANEVGLACALGVFGNQLGIAIGFIIPPIILTNECQDKEHINHQLSILTYPQVALNILILIILIFVFEESPEIFPSIAQATKLRGEPNYMASLKRLLKDGPFVLLLISYGIITGVYFAMSTIINEMVLAHFPGDEVDAGWMGAIMVLAGMVGSIFFEAFMDRTHQYKKISVIIFIVSFFLMAGYTALITLNRIWVQFLFFTFLGFFMTGYLPAGFDFGAEITYPEPEAMSASLLNTSTQIFSIFLTILSSSLLQAYGDFVSNILFCSSLLLGLIIMVFIKCNLKRANAGLESTKPVC